MPRSFKGLPNIHGNGRGEERSTWAQLQEILPETACFSIRKWSFGVLGAKEAPFQIKTEESAGLLWKQWLGLTATTLQSKEPSLVLGASQRWNGTHSLNKQISQRTEGGLSRPSAPKFKGCTRKLEPVYEKEPTSCQASLLNHRSPEKEKEQLSWHQVVFL